MMFPFADTESDDITEEEYVPKEYGIDFKTGQFVREDRGGRRCSHGMVLDRITYAKVQILYIFR